MIICMCRRLNDKAVQEAVDAGARSPDCVQAHHGCTFNCGKCRMTIGEMISDHVEKVSTENSMIAAE